MGARPPRGRYRHDRLPERALLLPDIPLTLAEATSGPEPAPAFLDRWRPCLTLAGLLIVVAYGPVLVHLALTTPLNAPGLRVW